MNYLFKLLFILVAIVPVLCKKGNNDFFSYFVEEAYKYPIDKDANHTAESISWLDEALLNRSAQFCKRNFFGVSLATFYSGIELFSIKSTTSVLMCTGTVKNREKTLMRVMRTMLHKTAWSNAGMSLLDPNDISYKAVNSVRLKHYGATFIASNRSAAAVEFMDKHVLEPPYKTSWEELNDIAAAVSADLKFVNTSEAPNRLLNWDTSSTVGQYDLGVVQFILLSHVVMHPKEFGIYNVDHEDMLAYIHYTAVYGRILGIEDKFNVALNLPRNMYDRFYRNIVVASLKNIDVHVVHVMDMVMKSIAEEFIFPEVFRLKCWLYHSLKVSVDGFKGKHILALMNWRDKICLNLLDASMGSINKSILFELVGDAAFGEWIKTVVKKNKIVFP